MERTDFDPLTGAMNARQIHLMLPHRFPFVFVDQVVECLPGRSITGFKNVARPECRAQPGGGYALPQLLVLEALAQLSVILTFRTLDVVPTGREQMFFAGIDQATFQSTVCPGDRLQLYAEVVRVMPAKGIGKFRTQATIDGQRVAGAVMMAAMRLG